MEDAARRRGREGEREHRPIAAGPREAQCMHLPQRATACAGSGLPHHLERCSAARTTTLVRVVLACPNISDSSREEPKQLSAFRHTHPIKRLPGAKRVLKSFSSSCTIRHIPPLASTALYFFFSLSRSATH